MSEPSVNCNHPVIGLNDQGKVIVCCDCPDENAGCQCILEVRLVATMAKGVNTHAGQMVYNAVIDTAYWDGRGIFDAELDEAVTSGNVVGDRVFYHTPDPVFLAASTNPADFKSNCPEIVDGGLAVSTALKAATYPNDDNWGIVWNYFKAKCDGDSDLNPNAPTFASTPLHKCESATAWNTSYFPNIPDIEALVPGPNRVFDKYASVFNQFTQDFEFISHSSIDTGSTASVHEKVYADLGGNQIRDPNTSTIPPSGLPLWTFEQNDPWNGYEHHCPNQGPISSTETYGYRAVQNAYQTITAKRVPRMAQVNWGGHQALIPVYPFNTITSSPGWRCTLGIRCYNGWENGDSFEGGAMDLWYYNAVSGGSQNYALGGCNPGSPPIIGGPGSLDATLYQGNPVWDSIGYKFDFLPASPCAGVIRVSFQVWSDPSYTQYPGWYASVAAAPWLGFGETKYINLNQTNPNYPNSSGGARRWFYNYRNPYSGPIGGTPPILPNEEESFQWLTTDGKTDLTFDPDTGGSGTIVFYVGEWFSAVNPPIAPPSWTKYSHDWSVSWVY